MAVGLSRIQPANSLVARLNGIFYEAFYQLISTVVSTRYTPPPPDYLPSNDKQFLSAGGFILPLKMRQSENRPLSHCRISILCTF